VRSVSDTGASTRLVRVVRAKALDVRYPVRKAPARSQPNTLGRHGLGRRGKEASAIGASRPGEGYEICLKGVSSPDFLLDCGDSSLIYP
jgi:hypothetical protein